MIKLVNENLNLNMQISNSSEKPLLTLINENTAKQKKRPGQETGKWVDKEAQPPWVWVITSLKLGKSVLPHSNQTRKNILCSLLEYPCYEVATHHEHLNTRGTSGGQAQDKV